MTDEARVLHAIGYFSPTSQFEQCHSYVVASACLWPDHVTRGTGEAKDVGLRGGLKGSNEGGRPRGDGGWGGESSAEENTSHEEVGG